MPVKHVLAVTRGARVHQSGVSPLGWSGARARPAPRALLTGAVGAGLLAGGSWLFLQVLKQQGRLLLRIEALEARLPPDGSAAERIPADTGMNPVPLTSPPVAAPAALLPSSHIAPAPAVSRPAEPLPPAREDADIDLTIGMATYDDFDGVYFTLQALRLYQDLERTELLVVDNYGCEHTRKLVQGWVGGRYVRAAEVVGTAAPRDLVFRQARGRAVLCCDSHVLFAPGAIARLKQFYRDHPDCQDLLQGPMLYDNGHMIATHFEPRWREQMWGIWASDPRGEDPGGEPFEIPMQGLGAFSCRKSAWLGFHPQFRGFGGEEGYIHEKFRQAGRRCLCLPWLRWMHRFSRPSGVRYPLTVDDKLRNYLLGHAELGLDPAPVLEHFSQYLPEDRVQAIAGQALADHARTDSGGVLEKTAREAASPFGFFDGVFCLNLDSDTGRWSQARRRHEQLDIAWQVERFPAVATPENHHRGNAMSFRQMVAEAHRRRYQHVLILEDDAVFIDDTVTVMKAAAAELADLTWDLCYLGACVWSQVFPLLPGCEVLQECGPVTCSHAVAVHCRAYDRILTDIPAARDEFDQWLTEYLACDQYLRRRIADGTFRAVITSPRVASQPSLLRFDDADGGLAERYVI